MHDMTENTLGRKTTNQLSISLPVSTFIISPPDFLQNSNLIPNNSYVYYLI